MTSTMEWIRRHYGVPARHRMRITYDGQPATIVGASSGHLRMRIDGQRHIVASHPTYLIVYPEVPQPPRPRGWCRHCGEDRAMTKDDVMGQHRPPWDTAPGATCPGVGEPPTHRVQYQTHPGEQRNGTATGTATAEEHTQP